MAVKKVIYKEPASYFTPGMLREAKKWEKEHAKKEKEKKSDNKSK